MTVLGKRAHYVIDKWKDQIRWLFTHSSCYANSVTIRGWYNSVLLLSCYANSATKWL